MRYDKKIADEVASTLGKPLPSPQSEAFDELLLELNQSNPALAAKLSSALVHDGLGDIETQARRQNAGESRWRRVTHVLFRRYDELDGEFHVSKLKLLGWGSLIPLGLLASLFLGPSLVGTSQPAVAGVAEPVAGTEPDVKVAATPQDDDPFREDVEAVSQNNRVTNAVTGSRTVPARSDEANRGADASLTEDEFGLDDADASSPDTQANPQTGSETETSAGMLSSDPQLPMTSEEDPGLGVYRAANGAESSDPGLVIYRAGGNVAGGGGSADPFAQQSSSEEGPVGLAAYRRAEPQEESPTGLKAFTKEPVQETELRAYRQPPQQTQVGAGTKVGLPESDAYLTSGLALTPPGERNVKGPGAAPYVVGDSLDATLQTGVVAIGDAPLPVLARAEDGSIWQGQATLTKAGRVDLRFTEVLAVGGQYQVVAVGQSGNGYLGLPAQVNETTPALASDLARGALRGLSDYVQALGDQTEVRLEGGTPIITQDAPPLEASIAGSVAQLFAPPEGDEQQALVRLAQVPAETPLKVVVLARNSEAP